MKNLYESLLDDDYVETMDDKILIDRLFDKDKSNDAMMEILKDLKSNYNEIKSKSKITSDKCYIALMKEDDTDDAYWIKLQIFTPTSSKFHLNQIVCNVDPRYYNILTTYCATKSPFPAKPHYPGEVLGTKSKYSKIAWRYVFELPDKYKFILKEIEYRK